MFRWVTVVLVATSGACASPAPGIDGAPAAADAAADAVPFPDGDPATLPVLAGEWGGRGTLPGQFIEPSSVELANDGRVIVAGHEDRVQTFTPDGDLLDIWGSPGAGDGEFNHPHGLAVDHARGGIVYIGDQENHRVQVFTDAGEFVRLWTDDQFKHIHDVGIDPDSGDVYVGDYQLDRVQEFSPTGTELAVIGGSGAGPAQFAGVWGVSTDSTGAIYVADTNNLRVQKFDATGAFVTAWTSIAGDPFVKPTGVFVDGDDRVHVCDSLAQTVAIFATDGTLLERWNLLDIIGRVTEPEDIVIDPTGTHIYIGEVREHRVFHLTRPPAGP
jgi:tripartite motif-containing protein 71